MRLRLLALLLLLPLGGLRADPVPAPLFTEGAVLQHGRALPVWGTASPGERITVSFAGFTTTTTAAPDGSWILLLGPLQPSAVPDDMRIQGNTTIVIPSLLVGEVWLCAGGTGMDWPLASTEQPDLRAQPAAPLRFARIPLSKSPADRIPWIAPAPGQCSSIAFHFAQQLGRRLEIPFGIIQVTCPGSALQAWMSPAAFKGAPSLAQAAGEHWQRIINEFPARHASFLKAEADWSKAAAKARQRGELNYNFFLKKNPQPRPPLGPDTPAEPSSLVSTLLSPTLPYAIRGVLWYQGEGNIASIKLYKSLFPLFISSLRSHFGDPELPFLYVQCPAFAVPDDPSMRILAELRHYQTDCLALPATGMALAIDQGAPNSTKNHDRQEIARRLALLAKSMVYNFETDAQGPTVQSITREGKGLRLSFSHADTGLIAAGRPVQSLEVAGNDHVYYPAQGSIKANELTLLCPQVSNPCYVRYAWSNAPTANLLNGAGLPAPPFNLEVSRTLSGNTGERP